VFQFSLPVMLFDMLAGYGRARCPREDPIVKLENLRLMLVFSIVSKHQNIRTLS
jgi:hypothetical protein